MIPRFLTFFLGAAVLFQVGLLRAGDPEQVDAQYEKFLETGRGRSDSNRLIHLAFGMENVPYRLMALYENARTGLRVTTFPTISPDAVGVGSTLIREVHVLDYFPISSGLIEIQFGKTVRHHVLSSIQKQLPKGHLPLAILKGRGDSETAFSSIDELVLLSNPLDWPRDRAGSTSSFARTAIGLKGAMPFTIGANILKAPSQRFPAEFISAQFSRPIIDLDNQEGLPKEGLVTSSVVVIEREYSDAGLLVKVTADIARASRKDTVKSLYLATSSGIALNPEVSIKWLARNLSLEGVSETRVMTLQPGAEVNSPIPCREFLAALLEAEGPGFSPN